MVDLSSRDRLQPSLIDRLIDNDPQQRKESLDARVLSRQQLRAARVGGKDAKGEIEGSITRSELVQAPQIAERNEIFQVLWADPAVCDHHHRQWSLRLRQVTNDPGPVVTSKKADTVELD